MTFPPLEAFPPFRTAHTYCTASRMLAFIQKGFVCWDFCVHLGKCRSPDVADGLDLTQRLPSTEILSFQWHRLASRKALRIVIQSSGGFLGRFNLVTDDGVKNCCVFHISLSRFKGMTLAHLRGLPSQTP